MNKELCFKIDSKELFLKQVLVEYNGVPVYFLCEDQKQVYYMVLCIDIDEEKYIIVKTSIEKVLKLLKQRITMRQIILCEQKYWNVVAGQTMDSDICNQYDMELVPIEELPYEESYFELVTEEQRRFLNTLQNELFLQPEVESVVLQPFNINNMLSD